jgi:hypothetical protein
MTVSGAFLLLDARRLRMDGYSFVDDGMFPVMWILTVFITKTESETCLVRMYSDLQKK